MPCLLPASPSAVRPKVLPVDRVARDGLEDNSVAGWGILSLTAVASGSLVALDEPAPPLVEARPSQQGELRAAPDELTVVAGGRINPGHEATHPAPSPQGGAPVEVVAVVPAWAVALGAQALDPDVVPPALEGPRARLDAPHRIRARDEGDLRVADGPVAMGLRAAIVGDCRRLEDGLAATRVSKPLQNTNSRGSHLMSSRCDLSPADRKFSM